ncbi:MAG: prolyl-tRNA synthetase associated domain-containing protein [Pseudomonadota bacterium]
MLDPHPDEARLYALLEDLSIPYQTVEHEAVFTVEEGHAIKARLPGGHTKNLFLKDKAGQFVLICALGNTPIRLNKLHPHIGTKRLSFGREEALFETLGVRPGSVTLFSILNDTECHVKLVLDQALLDNDQVWFHPLRNTASTRIDSVHLGAFARATGHEPLILDLASLSQQA